MKKFISLLSILFALNIQAQDKILTSDSTGKVYLLFVRPDSIAVIFQGENTAFTSDGLFAKDFAAFNLKLKGFLRFDGLKNNLDDVKVKIIDSTGYTKKDTVTVIKNDDYTIIKADESYQFDAPQWGHKDIGLWNNLSISVSKDYKLKATVDSRGWGIDENKLLYKVQDGGKWISKNELESINFSGQAGSDVVIYAGYQIGTYNWKATYTMVHLAASEASKTPAFMQRGKNKRMPQFVYNFPDFSLPNKTNIIQFQQLNDNDENVSNNYLKKGWSIASVGTAKQTYVADYDYWAYENGCPRGNHAGAIEWIKKNKIQDLYRWFEAGVINPSHGKGFTFLDFEAFGYDIGSDDVRNKLGTLFRKFHEKNPETLFTSYINANPFISVFHDGITAQQAALENEKYNKSFNEIKKGFWLYDVSYLDVYSGEFTGERGNLGDYITPWVGGYSLYINQLLLYSTIQDLELSQKHVGEVLTLNWGLIENVIGSDFEIWQKFFQKNNGLIYQHNVKPPISSSYAYNIAVWSNFLGKGTWWWDEPLPFHEGFEHHGSSSRDLNDSKWLDVDFTKNFGGFHYAAQIAYDYATKGLYDISKVEFGKEIFRPSFSVNGKKYNNENLLPASAELLKIPIVRAKRTNNGWAILAVNVFQNHWEKQKLTVEIEGKLVDVWLNGQFSTLVKI